MQDKAKEISELYDKKSKLFEALSIIMSPSNDIILGYIAVNPRFYSTILELRGFDDEFMEDIKMQCKAYYENKINEIDKQIEILLKC